MKIFPILKNLLLFSLVVATGIAQAETIGCVTTAWKLIGANHKVCVEAFHDPKVPGVTCHVSQARTGGISGAIGLARDPSQFSLACRQTGPIVLPAKLPKDETVFSEDTSILFKEIGNYVEVGNGRQDSVVARSFLAPEFQRLLRGGKLDGFDFGSVPIAA